MKNVNQFLAMGVFVLSQSAFSQSAFSQSAFSQSPSQSASQSASQSPNRSFNGPSIKTATQDPKLSDILSDSNGVITKSTCVDSNGQTTVQDFIFLVSEDNKTLKIMTKGPLKNIEFKNFKMDYYRLDTESDDLIGPEATVLGLSITGKRYLKIAPVLPLVAEKYQQNLKFTVWEGRIYRFSLGATPIFFNKPFPSLSSVSYECKTEDYEIFKAGQDAMDQAGL